MLEITLNTLAAFVFLYPALMTLIWMTGALFYYYRREHEIKGGQ